MNTLKLFWFFLWRATLLGLVLGAGLGAACGATPGIIVLVVGLLIEGSVPETAPPLAILGTIYGAAFGTIVGIFLGVTNSFLLTAIVRFYYRHSLPSNAQRYRGAAGWICATVSFSISLVAIPAVVLLGLQGPPTQGWQLDPSLLDPSLVSRAFLSACVVALTAWWLARVVTGWYAEKVQE